MCVCDDTIYFDMISKNKISYLWELLFSREKHTFLNNFLLKKILIDEFLSDYVVKKIILREFFIKNDLEIENNFYYFLS